MGVKSNPRCRGAILEVTGGGCVDMGAVGAVGAAGGGKVGSKVVSGAAAAGLPNAEAFGELVSAISTLPIIQIERKWGTARIVALYLTGR